jgi:hypothetical protein
MEITELDGEPHPLGREAKCGTLVDRCCNPQCYRALRRRLADLEKVDAVGIRGCV